MGGPTKSAQTSVQHLHSEPRFYNHIKSRPLPSGGKAFIDFAEPQQAASAKTALQGFKVTPEKAIQLTFAKN